MRPPARAPRGRRTSVPRGLERSVAWLEKRPAVRRLIFGHTRGRKHPLPVGELVIRRVMRGGLDVAGYGDNNITFLYVGVEPGQAEAVAGEIRARFAGARDG